MSTKKRRIVYLTNEEWEAAKRQGAPFLLTASQYIASLITGGRIAPQVVVDQIAAIERDLIAKPHPFVQFRPAPKPGKKP